MIETLLLSLALRVTGLGVQKPDTEQTAGTLHPVGTVLRAVVKVDTARNAVLLDALFHGIFHDGLFHVAVKLCVDDVACSIVDQAG